MTRKITITEHFKAIFSSCIPASSNYKRKIPKEISITLQNLYENFAIKNKTDQKRNIIYEPNKFFFFILTCKKKYFYKTANKTPKAEQKRINQFFFVIHQT